MNIIMKNAGLTRMKVQRGFCSTDGLACLRFFVQMQKGQLPKRPPTDLPHLYLCQRGSVGDPALHPFGCQSHPSSPAQRNHPGG